MVQSSVDLTSKLLWWAITATGAFVAAVVKWAIPRFIAEAAAKKLKEHADEDNQRFDELRKLIADNHREMTGRLDRVIELQSGIAEKESR